MKQKLVPVREVLKRLVKEGSLQSTSIGKESYRYIGNVGIHPHCPAGEDPQEILILSDSASAIAVCAKHWLHITL